MGQHFWSGVLAVVVSLLILVAATIGFALIGVELFFALLLGWLLSAGACLSLGVGRPGSPWRTVGCIEIGGVLLSALIWQGVALWWWPVGLIALAMCYLALTQLFSGAAFSGWRAALEFSAPFVAGVGAVWELGQIFGTYLLLNQGTALLAEEAAALHASFVLSSLLLVCGSLFWGLARRRLLALALTALLVAQLAAALVIDATEVGNPSTNGLLALALLMVALACHAGTYPLRFTQPALAPGKSLPFGRLFGWRHGWVPLKEAIHSWRDQESWWLCLLLDSFSLLLCLVAALPVSGASAGDAPNSAPLIIVLSAGFLLSLSVAYWQNTAGFLLLGGLFLGLDLFTMGALAGNPAIAWPLLYLSGTLLLVGAHIWLARFLGRSWILALLLVAAGYGALALTFAFRGAGPLWGVGIIAALALAALLTYRTWRERQPAR